MRLHLIQTATITNCNRYKAFSRNNFCMNECEHLFMFLLNSSSQKVDWSVCGGCMLCIYHITKSNPNNGFVLRAFYAIQQDWMIALHTSARYAAWNCPAMERIMNKKKTRIYEYQRSSIRFDIGNAIPPD